MSQDESSKQENISDFDFGNPELNDAYRKLDEDTKKELDKIAKKEFQIEVLQKIINPFIQEVYEKLSEKDKAKVDNMKLREKYRILGQLAKQRQMVKAAQEQEKVKEQVKELRGEEKEKEQVKELVKELKEQEEKEDGQEQEEEEEEEEQQQKQEQKQREERRGNVTDEQRFNNIVRQFWVARPFDPKFNLVPELEVKFGTRGIKTLNKNDYDNVVKKLKSSGFYTLNAAGESMLRINSEFNRGEFRVSNIRTEIRGLHNIQQYCKNNDIKEIMKNDFSSVSFLSKKPVIVNGSKVFPENFDKFNFRISYMNEEEVKTGVKQSIIEKWKDSKKEFRFINRVQFANKELPFKIDISIVKFGKRSVDKYGRANKGAIIPVYTTEESRVFENEEIYEIEIEVDNKALGKAPFNNPDSIANGLRSIIKIVLSGLQGTNFPISYPEQSDVLLDYMKLIWGKDYDERKRVENRNFIGPSSITLQMVNIAANDSNSTQPNVRKDFVVTDKADGQRHLMYINAQGKIYLINMNMVVVFTGAKSLNEECFNSLLDGELILHNKVGEFINLFAVFDIYYMKKEDIRHLRFLLLPDELDLTKSRYDRLKFVVRNLKAVSILDEGKKQVASAKELLKKFVSSDKIMCPIRIVAKEFFPTSGNKDSIFSACNFILTKFKEGRFEYETDGLIFTHAYYGVGSEKIDEAGPKTKITWRQSFKWKPPKYNTIDFLVTTVKGQNGEDLVNTIFEDGTNTSLPAQLTEYKTIELRCGFNSKNDGYINPCQDIIDDKLPEFKQRFEDKKENDYLPTRFYPTEPYDPEAGLCKIILRKDGSGSSQMFSEENEVFQTNTIVEFSYDLTRQKGERWVPLRVRYDKTSELRKGEKQYGNSYKTANENWKSIHNPITEEMLCSGSNIPDVLVSEDIYYNKPAGELMTEAMKNFHNLYVKKKLILSVSKHGDTLIDYACGKAGDLPKWIAAKLSFVFGLDYSKENLENRIDGSCARYLNSRKVNKIMPHALFVHGNSAYNIKKGDALLSDRAKQITSAVFGLGSKDPEKIGKGVARQYGVGEEGFSISSCQFAVHYFLENPDTLKGFVKNIAECTKLNGYFIGTAYDGKLIFNMLKKIKTNESVKIEENGKKIWEITKRYGGDKFEDDSSSIGYKIEVFQESINQQIPEYLINFDYFDRVMDAYGFKIVNREEAIEMGLPEGSGLFSELFANMLEEIKKNKFKEKDYGEATQMNAFEKKISFLNRYFVYKKIMEVNSEKVEIELVEYDETDALRNGKESAHAEEVAEEEQKQFKTKSKVRVLKKKLLLVPATEALDDQPLIARSEEKEKEEQGLQQQEKQEEKEKEKEKEKKTKKPRTTKPKKQVQLIIEEDVEP